MFRINLNRGGEKNDMRTLIRNSLMPSVLINEVFCTNCNKKSNKTENKYYIKRLPPYILISVNLTSYDSIFSEPKKVFEKIEPIVKLNILDVFMELTNNAKNLQVVGEYNLYAIIIHRGRDTEFGHYYTLGRNLEKNSSDYEDWYIFNDREVSKIGKNLNLQSILEKYETPTLFFFENSKKISIESNCSKTIRY